MSREAKDEWPRKVRALDFKENAFLSKNALNIREVMSTYDVREPSDHVSAEGLDVVFAKWLEDPSTKKMADANLIAVLGITFGNYLCDRLSMQWVEVTDDAGTTYGVRHEVYEVFCFPLETVKKRVSSREIGIFVQIDAVVREKISNSSTKHRG